jgi:hypothetical protein
MAELLLEEAHDLLLSVTALWSEPTATTGWTACHPKARGWGRRAAAAGGGGAGIQRPSGPKGAGCLDFDFRRSLRRRRHVTLDGFGYQPAQRGAIPAEGSDRL